MSVGFEGEIEEGEVNVRHVLQMVGATVNEGFS